MDVMLWWLLGRTDIPELMEIRSQFKKKYGKEFEEMALTNEGNVGFRFSFI